LPRNREAFKLAMLPTATAEDYAGSATNRYRDLAVTVD
jgi:hypothetical protein